MLQRRAGKGTEKDMLKWTAPVSDQLIRSAGITSGQTILDVATGTGQPAMTIAKKNHRSEGKGCRSRFEPGNVRGSRGRGKLYGAHKYSLSSR